MLFPESIFLSDLQGYIQYVIIYIIPNFYELNDREWEVFKTAMFKIIEITLRAKLGFSEKFNKFSVEQIFKLSEDKIKEILTDGTEKQITFCWANNNEKGV